MSTSAVLLWVVFPYMSLTLLIVGLIWRYREDQYGWTSRSSQWNENHILRWSSPMFHFGILFVGLGHVGGLFVPAWLTEAMGISEHLYHVVAVSLGSLAGVVTIIGFAGLMYRRIVVKSVRLATTRNDILMYCLLTIAILLGAFATASTQFFGESGGYDYRQTISPWFRSLFLFHPQPELMVDVPLSFKLHILAGLLLFAVWPFTRLVHAVSMPVGYTTRPYVVYRSRPAHVQAAKEPQGWRPVHTQGTGNADNVDLSAPSQGA